MKRTLCFFNVPYFTHVLIFIAQPRLQGSSLAWLMIKNKKKNHVVRAPGNRIFSPVWCVARRSGVLKGKNKTRRLQAALRAQGSGCHRSPGGSLNASALCDVTEGRLAAFSRLAAWKVEHVTLLLVGILGDALQLDNNWMVNFASH